MDPFHASSAPSQAIISADPPAPCESRIRGNFAGAATSAASRAVFPALANACGGLPTRVIEAPTSPPPGLPSVSVAHYGEQTGDLMRDAEMCFELGLAGWPHLSVF